MKVWSVVSACAIVLCLRVIESQAVDSASFTLTGGHSPRLEEDLTLGGSTGGGSGGPPQPLPLNNSIPCDLECWLSSLVITLPPMGVDKDGVAGELDNFECKYIEINGIGSNLAHNMSGVFVAVYDIAIQCSGKWKYSLFKVFKGSGTVAFDVERTTLGFGVDLIAGPDHLANSTSFSNCSMALNINNLKFSGGLSGSILNLFSDTIVNEVDRNLPAVVCGELDKLVTTNLTSVLGDINAKVRPYLGDHRPVAVPVPPPKFNNLAVFKGAPIMGLLHYFTDTLVGANGTLGLNKLMNFATNGTGYAAVPPSLISLLNAPPVYVPALGAQIQIGVKEFSMAGLNTWLEFSLFDKINNQTVESHTLMETVDASLVFFVNVSFMDTVDSPILHGKYLYEEGNISIALSQADLKSTLLLWMNASGINELEGTQFADPGCLLGQFYAANLTELYLNLSINEFKVTDVGRDRGPVGKQIDGMINNVISVFTNSYRGAIPAGINGLIATTVVQVANDAIAKSLKNPNTTMCAAPLPPKAVEDPTNNFHILYIASGTWLLLCVLVISMHVCHRIQRKAYIDAKMHLLVNYGNDAGSGLVSSATAGSAGGAATPGRRRLSSASTIASIMRHQHHNRPWDLATMVTHRKLSWFTRLFIPAALIGNISLFLSSNLSQGAGVVPVIVSGSKEIVMPSIFDFSLASTVKNMWIAGVYPLCILVAVFSGGWPYLKLVIMLFCWCIPTRLLKPRRREQILEVVDALGKWSLIDSYVMILMLVAFSLTIKAPADAATGTREGANFIRIYVEPYIGFYTFLAATMLSLALSNIILNLHRYTEDPMTGKKKKARKDLPGVAGSARDPIVASSSTPDAPDSVYNAPAEALCRHSFQPKKLQGQKIRFNLFGRLLLALLLVSSEFLMCVGMYIQSFNFEFKGLAAFVLDFLHQDVRKSFSVLSLGMAVPGASRAPDSVGIRYIQVSFFIFTIAVPLAHMATVLFVWLMPLKPRWQERVFKLSEIFMGWAALEVMIVSVIVALLEIQQFAQFTIQDACGAINKLLAQYFNEMLDGDPRCFDVIARLQAGCWVLFAAGVIYLSVAQAIMRMCHAALVSRRDTAKSAVTRQRRLSRDAHGVYGAILDEDQSETSESSDEGRNEVIYGQKKKPYSLSARLLMSMPFVEVYDPNDMNSPVAGKENDYERDAHKQPGYPAL